MTSEEAQAQLKQMDSPILTLEVRKTTPFFITSNKSNYSIIIRYLRRFSDRKYLESGLEGVMGRAEKCIKVYFSE